VTGGAVLAVLFLALGFTHHSQLKSSEGRHDSPAAASLKEFHTLQTQSLAGENVRGTNERILAIFTAGLWQ
jgi:hypothetical protein